jgi:hypothetical protein
METSWALAPEVRLSMLSSEKGLIAPEISKSVPQGLKAHEMDCVYAGDKSPAYPKTIGFPQPVKPTSLLGLNGPD